MTRVWGYIGSATRNKGGSNRQDREKEGDKGMDEREETRKERPIERERGRDNKMGLDLYPLSLSEKLGYFFSDKRLYY